MVSDDQFQESTHQAKAFSIRGFGRWIVVLVMALLTLRLAAFAAPAGTPSPRQDTPASPTSTSPRAASPSAPGTPSTRSTAKKASEAGPAGATDYNIRVTAKTLRYDDMNHFLTLDGNVVFTHLDTQITSPHAEFYTDKQVGFFTRGVRITQPGTTITSSKVSVYYAERKAILTGNVVVVTEKVKPLNAGPSAGPSTEPGAGPSTDPSAAPSTANQGKTTQTGSSVSKPPATALPSVLLCNELHYWWEKQEGDAIGDVKIRQGDKRGFSDRAHYVGLETRTVHMYSNVRYERGPDDWMTCEDAVIDMNTNVFTGNGNVEAYVKLQSTPASVPLTTPVKGDRVLKPAPPLMPDVRRAPDGLPSPLDHQKNPQSTEPAVPEETPGDSSTAH